MPCTPWGGPKRNLAHLGRTPVAGGRPTNPRPPREAVAVIAGSSRQPKLAAFSSPSGDGWPTLLRRVATRACRGGKRSPTWPVKAQDTEQLVLMLGAVHGSARGGSRAHWPLRLLQVPIWHRACRVRPVRALARRRRPWSYDTRSWAVTWPPRRAGPPLSSISPARRERAAERPPVQLLQNGNGLLDQPLSDTNGRAGSGQIRGSGSPRPFRPAGSDCRSANLVLGARSGVTYPDDGQSAAPEADPQGRSLTCASKPGWLAQPQSL